MSSSSKIVAAGNFDEMWSSAFREKGFRYDQLDNLSSLAQSDGDCFLIDSRNQELSEISLPHNKPFLPMVSPGIDRQELEKLRSLGAAGYIDESVPPEEVSIRLRALLNEFEKPQAVESRAARRVWYQTQVHFQAFDKKHKAWSTTLSETGIFLHTNLSFPLYSVIRLSFNLLGEKDQFDADGVIVRQEIDGDVRGFGVMFQNLKGENVRILESFLELYS